MKKVRTGLIVLAAVAGIGYTGILLYFNSGSKAPDNTVWQSYIGRDTIVPILPDVYANYFTYTVVRTNKNTGFRIRGEFPDTRYMSFNVYSRDNATLGSLVDYTIESDSGLPNPWIANKDSVETGKSFTTYILPERYREHDVPNKLYFSDDARFVIMIIRLYDFNQDDFGGVEFPTVEAVTLDGDSESFEIIPVQRPKALDLSPIVRRFSLDNMVDRFGTLFQTENLPPMDGSPEDTKYYEVPFYAGNAAGLIENNDNRYLISAVTKREDEVFVFKFKAPSYTTGPENIMLADMRYWSFNLGNEGTYNFNGLKDEDAIQDEDGFVHIVLADADAEVQLRTAEMGYNFMEWNMPWEKGLILFRHMLAHPYFEAQIDDVPKFNASMTEYASIEAHKHIGDYAPLGIRMSKEEFLNVYSREVLGVEQ